MNTNHITFTRFLAALPIVIYHFGNQVFPFGHSFLKPVVAHAYLGVSYFFLLSGFVMTIAYKKKSGAIRFWPFLQNRAARILPLYYLALFLMVLYLIIRIYILSTPSRYYPTIPDFLLHFFLLQAWVPGKAHTLNTAAWSLSVEALFYVIFPFFFNTILSKISLGKLGIFTGLFFVFSQLLYHYLHFRFPAHQDFLSCFPLLHLNEFAAGCVFGLFYLRNDHLHRNNLGYILLMAGILVAVFHLPQLPVLYANGLLLPLFLPLLYFIAYDNGPLARVFSRKKMMFLGEISYGVYILQFPVYFFFTALLTFAGFKINQPLFYVYLLLLLIVSAISFQIIEKPLRRYLRSV